MTTSADRVAELLNRHAELLQRAADDVRALALRAEKGEAGDPYEGLGYHYLVDRALTTTLSAMSNIPFGQAFQRAAVADDVERGDEGIAP